MSALWFVTWHDPQVRRTVFWMTIAARCHGEHAPK